MSAFFSSVKKKVPTTLEQLNQLLEVLKISWDSEKSLDDKTVQKTAVFDKHPKVVIVASLDSKEPITNYKLLPEFTPIDKEQEKCINSIAAKLENNGDNILVKDCSYDPKENFIFLEAIRVPYAIIRALATNQIKLEQFLFKTGVMVPLITTDRKVVFIRRSTDGFFSAPGGFLQPLNDRDLAFSCGGVEYDLVRCTALKELKEEIFGAEDGLEGIHLSSHLGVSVRYPANGSIPTFEFIQPIYVPQTEKELIVLLQNNKSKDKDEHSQEYFVFDYSDKELFRKSLLSIGSKEKPGYFLYLPMLETIFPTFSKELREKSTQSGETESTCSSRLGI